MRRYDAPISVMVAPPSPRRDVAGVRSSLEPVKFRWRGQVWNVDQLLTSWVEFRSWWETGVGGAEPGQQEIWRVYAVSPALAESGIYELSYDLSSDSWLLRSVVD